MTDFTNSEEFLQTVPRSILIRIADSFRNDQGVQRLEIDREQEIVKLTQLFVAKTFSGKYFR